MIHKGTKTALLSIYTNSVLADSRMIGLPTTKRLIAGGGDENQAGKVAPAAIGREVEGKCKVAKAHPATGKAGARSSTRISGAVACL